MLKDLREILDFFNKGEKDTLMDREVRRLSLPFSLCPSACVCVCSTVHPGGRIK